jgi:FtsP/CotA-like multicopper oxidase with cupredoxin domain
VLQVLDLEAGEQDWEPTSGTVVNGYAYNAQVPGPVIEATVGDTLLVRFTNRLPEPTSIHWHGIRIPAAEDGSGLTAKVPPGRTVDYRFELPDAGTLWYHPYDATQLERGLYGAILVRDPAEPRLDAERVLILDHLDLERLDVLLVNGVREPHMHLPARQVERWRLVNAARTHSFNLSFGGRRFHVVGSDGGLIAAPQLVTELLITPGERYDLVVGPFTQTVTVVLEALAHHRGAGKPWRHSQPSLGTPRPDDGSTTVGVRLRRFRRDIPPLARPGIQRTRTVHLGGRCSRHGGAGMVDATLDMADVSVPVGELQVWDLVNDTDMDHPFHLHGFFFQVLDVNGTPPPYRSWKDSLSVPARGRVTITWLPDHRPGGWTHDCHL